jgi:hypothetical protein
VAREENVDVRPACTLLSVDAVRWLLCWFLVSLDISRQNDDHTLRTLKSLVNHVVRHDVGTTLKTGIIRVHPRFFFCCLLLAACCLLLDQGLPFVDLAALQ